MESVQPMDGAAFCVPRELDGEVLGSPYESLELSDDDSDGTSSQAGSDLSLPLSDGGRDSDNQRGSVFVASGNVSCDATSSLQDLWEERLKKSAFQIGDLADNQNEDEQHRQDKESSSDHSIVDSEAAHIQDDSSLSLSKSSSSEDDGPVEWLENASSASSGSGEVVADAVLISSDDEQGEYASSTSDAHWLSDSSSQCSSAYAPEWVDDHEDQQLWDAFDATLQVHTVFEPSTNSVLDFSHTIAYDEDYEASASESASSLEDSDDESAHDINRLETRAAFHPRLSVGYDTASDVDSLVSLPSTSDRRDSSVSSLAFQSSEERLAPPDPLLDPLSSSCDEDAQSKGSRWIENIPASTQTTSSECTHLNERLDQPRIWKHNEYVVAEDYGARQRRGLARISAYENSVDSLSEEDVGTSSISPSLAMMPPPPQKTGHYTDLHETEAYVGYSDLAGILERYAPRQPAVSIDLGCGTSRLCAELVFHGHRFVYGVDRDLTIIDYQRHCSVAAGLKSFVQFLPMDVSESLAFPDKFSDFIVSKATFDEIATRCLRLREPRELLVAFKETLRCLKTGGILMVVAFQDQYTVDIEDAVESVVVPDDATPVERASFRLQMPWWKWTEVKGLFARELSLIARYELGCPTHSDRGKTKPYRVLVWRRNESQAQRSRRLAGEIRVQKQMEREYDARVQQKTAEIERTVAELKMVTESRQMILEDEASASRRRQENLPETMKQRAERREAFYAAMLEEERCFMVVEDEQGMMRRNYETQALSVAREVLAHMIEKVFLATPAAPDVGVVAVASAASLEPVSKARSAQKTPPVDALPAQMDAAGDTTWLREEVLKIVDAADASAASKELQKPAQRRRRGQNPTQGPVQPAPVSQTLETTSQTGIKAAESTTEVDVHGIAEHTVIWIVSCSVSAIQATGSAKSPDLLTYQPSVLHVEARSPIIVTETAQTPPQLTAEPVTQSGAAVDSVAPVTETSPPDQHVASQSPEVTPHPSSVEITPVQGLTPAVTPNQVTNEPSIGVAGEELLVCGAVLEAIVSQVSQLAN